MKKDHVVLNFVKIAIAEKIEVGRSVESKMKLNPSFTSPDVPLEELKASTDMLEARNVAAITGGKEATALMHQAEEQWVDKMRKTALYVDRIADGDAAIILSAGFDLAKQPSPAVRPEFSVELGEKSGTVLLRRQKVEGARSYVWQYTTQESPILYTDWINAEVTSKASVALSGLKPLTTYWFRVAAVTTEGTGAYTMPIMQVVI